jgi:adenylosuccinate lyase
VTAGDIALIIGALATLVTAVAGLISAVQRKAAKDADALEEERDRLRSRVEWLLRHVHALRLLLAEHGIAAPAMASDPDDETEGAR